MQPITVAGLEQLYGRLLKGGNRWVYEATGGKEPYHRQPHSMFFYYIDFLDDGELDVRHYHFDNGKDPIEPGDLKKIIRSLALNARNKDQVPPQSGKSWQNIVWRRKSYIVILMDSAKWTFIPGKALVFNPEKGSQDNQSFLDGQDLRIDVSEDYDGTEMVTAFCCINHMKKNDKGDDIDKDPTGKPEKQKFVFTLAFNVAGFPDPHTIDPGGENMGPPVPPPAPP